MLTFIKSLWLNLMYLGQLIGNERGQIGEGGDGGGQDDGAGAQTETTAETDRPEPSQDAQQTDTQTKADWRLEKYGPDWESTPQYWKDNAGYAWDQLKAEKAKRTGKVIPLEEMKLKDADVAAKFASQTNGNGNGTHTDAADGGKPKFEDVDQLLEHINKQNEQFFEKNFTQKLTERERESSFRNSMQKARADNKGDPDNGIPSFADVEQEVLIPLVESNPKVLALLKELPGDPAQNAYTLAIVVKARNINGLRDLFQRQGREQFAKTIQDVSKQAVRVKGGRSGPTSAELTAADITSMPKEDFEKLVAKNTGRM